ncbi:MAG: glycoside hydrolase family 99-like domain-containing protein [Planctomycetota bacterium]
MKIAAYVYPGWHPCEERDRHFPPGFTEWDLVYASRPRFEGHIQPRLPLWGRYNDADPAAVGPRVALARGHGVDLFVYGFFWCRGKRVFQEALDEGFLSSPEGRTFPFAVMWANRLPRRILPVKRREDPVVEKAREVPSDVEDFIALIRYLAGRYFSKPNYFHLDGKPFFSIYDSTFFLRELGEENAARALAGAREWLRRNGFPGLHMAAIDPAWGYLERMKAVGFDSVTHYVFLPEWKGPFLQDYRACALRRAQAWEGIASASGLPYFPSISTGWDASPRGADFGKEKPKKYPWWPVVVGESPARFQEALSRAAAYTKSSGVPEPLVFVASFNEWSEGHYLEPDTRFGTGWVEALQAVKRGEGKEMEA